MPKVDDHRHDRPPDRLENRLLTVAGCVLGVIGASILATALSIGVADRLPRGAAMSRVANGALFVLLLVLSTSVGWQFVQSIGLKSIAHQGRHAVLRGALPMFAVVTFLTAVWYLTEALR